MLVSLTKHIPKLITYTERNNLTCKIRIFSCCHKKNVLLFWGPVQKLTTPLCKSLPFQGKNRTVLMSSNY